jgi:TonB family protein
MSEWSEERVYVVLCHELAHVRRFDWPVQTAAEVVRGVLWFNPLAWIACSRLRRDSEQACDDIVLQRGVAPHDYAAHLLDIVRACRVPARTALPILRMARPSTLERRIADMLNPRIDRQFSVRTAGIACALLLAVTIPTATLRATQTGPAALSGTVYDPTGGVMPGVALTLEDATQMTVETKTNPGGRFAFSNVQPGHYTLEASLPGFRTLKQQFDLAAPADWDRAITLQIGDLRESVTVTERRSSTTVAPAAPQSQRIRVGGSVRPPLKTLDVKPVYPASMRNAGREGIVPIEATIGVDGTVTSVRVLSAQVHPDFAIAAADAVRQWRFTPTLLNGSPVEVVMNVSVTFTLSDQ